MEARLNRHSGNSSQPASQDPPQAPKNHRGKSVRHPSGQSGHQGNHRQLAPPEKVDKVVEHRAEACPHGRSLLAERAGRPAALAVPYREAQEAVTHADMAHADETGWQGKGKRHWLWVAVTGAVTVFLVFGSRGRKALMELIGEAFAGILHRDRRGAYNRVDRFRRQLCWAHLKRDFQALSESGRRGPVRWEPGDSER